MDDWDRDCEQAIEELWQDIRTAAEARALRTMLPALRQVLAVTFQEGADDARI